MKIKELQKIDIFKIKLDPENPRLHMTIKRENESIEDQLLRTVEPSKMLELMKNLLDRGRYNPSAVFSLLKIRDGNYFSLDGNRRTLATILLKEDPNKIKNIEISKFLKENSKKIKKFLNINKEITSTIYETRDDADEWINMIHTISEKGVSTLPWDTLARRLAKKDKLALAIKEVFDINKFEAKSLTISYTVIERLFDDATIKEKFGVVKTKLGIIEIQEKDLFIKFIKFLLEKNYGVANVYSKIDKMNVYNGFIYHINKKQKKNPNNIGKKKNTHNIKDNSVDEVNNVNQIKNKPIKIKKTKQIIFEPIPNYTNNEKIKNIIKEAKKLTPISSYKNILSLILRPLIEISVVEYLKNVMKWSNSKLDSNNLSEKIKIVIEDMDSKTSNIAFEYSNKSTIKHINDKENIRKMLLLFNGNLHDPKLIMNSSEFKDWEKRVTILIWEIWKRIN